MIFTALNLYSVIDIYTAGQLNKVLANYRLLPSQLIITDSSLDAINYII
jgi:hypothetical protein